MQVIPCFSCNALVPDIEGPTHRYMESSPGCWAAYGQVLAREYSDVTFAINHRLTVDAYAVQHPGQPSPQSIQSVCLHLVSLQLVLERAVDHSTATGILQQLAALKETFHWLEPPDSLGELTVNHVLAATSAIEHREAVVDWANSVWQAWEVHHALIRAWGLSALPR
jgi:hypothetical protein